MFTGFETTNKGYQYIAAAKTGKTLVLTKGQYGSGALPEGAEMSTMTELVAPIADMPITKKTVLDKSSIISTQFSNRVNGVIVNAFHFMEAGLFGKLKNADGTDCEDGPEALLFYGNALTTEIADYIPAVLNENLINWTIDTSGAANVTVEINESLLYPTLEEFNRLVAQKVIAGGTSNSLTIESEVQELKDKTQFIVTLTEDIGNQPTISYNGSDPLPVYNPDGSEIKEGQFVAGSTMNVIYSEEDQCWYLIGGGGGAVEKATEEEALAGTDDEKMMTPAKVALYVNKRIGDIDTILNEINGEVI